MAYTVISVFPATVDTEEIKKDLTDHGFDAANIIVSKSKLESGSSEDDYEEDVKTRNFRNFVFTQDAEMLVAYGQHRIEKNLIPKV